MAHIITGDLACETTTSTGTGSLTLAGAVAGHQTFAQIGVANGDTFEAVIRSVGASNIPTGDWERSICTYSTTGPSITRSVIQSSNSDALVNFASGTKLVYRINTREHEFLAQAAVDLNHSGLVSGGTLSGNADPTKFDVAAGVGYVNNGTGALNSIKRVTWGALTAQSNVGAGLNHVAFDSSGAINVSLTKQSLLTHVYVGYFLYDSNIAAIPKLWNVPELAGNYGARVNEFVRRAIGPIVADGLVVTEGGTALTLSVSAGEIYSGLTKTTNGVLTTFVKLFGCSDFGIAGDSANPNACNVTQWNDATQVAASALVTMTNGYWKKDAVFIDSEGALFYSIGRAEYATEDQARAAPIPGFATFYADLSVFLAELIIQKSATSVTGQIVDIRPTLQRVFFSQNTVSYDEILERPDHNDIPNAQGGSATERYHLSAADYTGTGTGVLVRADSATLVAPNLGTPSAAVGTNFSGIPQSAVTNLVSDLAGKAASGHSHSGLAPAGGTAGQVLGKVDGTDYNYAWQDSGSSGLTEAQVLARVCIGV